MRKKPRPEGRRDWAEWGERGEIFLTELDKIISLCFDNILLKPCTLNIEIRFEKYKI